MTELSYLDLIGRLTDLTRLATPPPPDERTGTFSSYDRRSRYNASTKPGTPTTTAPASSATKTIMWWSLTPPARG